MKPLAPEDRLALAPQVRLQLDPATGEPALLYPEGILMLNPTAHEIVSRCDGTASIEAILAHLAAEFEVTEEQLRADVFECLHELSRRRLILCAP